MKPERLLHQLIFERSAITIVAGGGTDLTWTQFARARAELIEGGMTETQGERGAVSTEEYVFRARWTPGVTLADGVSYGGARYNIVGISEIGRREGLEIKVRRIGP